jgi:hypothetical protein
MVVIWIKILIKDVEAPVQAGNMKYLEVLHIKLLFLQAPRTHAF